MASYGKGVPGSSQSRVPDPDVRPADAVPPIYDNNLEEIPSDTSSHTKVELSAAQNTIPRRKFSARWWVLSSISAAALLIVTLAVVYLLARRNSRVDQLVILTVPSGAEVELDSKPYGRSPIKLEQIPAGVYSLRITKENFEPIEESISITESSQRDYKLKPIAPFDSSSRSREENIKKWQQDAEDRFARGRYAIPYDDSAHYYAGLILGEDESNAFALDMIERVHKVLLQSARVAASRGDVGQAQEIYSFLVEYYPRDEEARMAQVRLEAQLSARRGEVRELVGKAETALSNGLLVAPDRASAYYFAKQAHTIDRFNDKAKGILDTINRRLNADGEQAANRKDFDVAVAKFENIVKLFPDDKLARQRLRDMESEREAEARASSPEALRIRGLASYREGRYSEAIPDLEKAMFGGAGGTDVVFSLARSHQKTGNIEKAKEYYKKIQPEADEAYRSSIAALGEIANAERDTDEAVRLYKKARNLGGSTLYSIAELDARIEQIERREKEKEAEPQPFTVRARHQHGGLLGGSCSGPLTVDSTGVRFDGTDHVFSSSLVGVGVRISGDEMILQLQKSSQKFKIGRADAERFREALSKYQHFYATTR
jgi:tetratricopeptide (TPR) repeat protein